ncbi:terminase small subunit [uncultured Christiangramia sp.]|uniref:terminase small subunit n=1 Tax=uncultured Christiangramia sp. TaxID=503836 RepID=UPI00262D81A4|nr:terminase small subunit [uncultured Christiangramia sp.]
MTDKTFQKYKLVIDQWFVNGFNGTMAYKEFYPKAKRADDSFSKIQRIPEVQEYIKQKEDEAKKALRTTHEVLLEELENWAYSDITETLLLTPDQVKELPPEVRRLITKYETTTRRIGSGEQAISETTVKLSFVSKEKAMEMIHKHTGFYEKDNEQKGNIVTETREERDRRIEELIQKRNAAD